MERRMDAEMAQMDTMMGDFDSPFFARDRDTLDEFFLLSRLGAFPSSSSNQRHLHDHRGQRLSHGRPLTEREERERRARKAQSAFREAARQGDARRVATLLAHQVVGPAIIDAPYTLGGHETSPMLDACGAGHVDVVRLLIEHGGDVNRRVGHATPLYVAAKAGHGRVVELLLEHGAETQPRLGTRRNSAVAELPGGSLVRDTPLHAAIRQHHNDVIDMLLGRGASFLSPDYAGDTPMDLLRRWAQDI